MTTTEEVVETEEQKPTPVIFDHCVRVYKEMLAQARPEEVEGEPANVYEGHLTKLFAQLELAMPYYTSVRKKLINMGCLVQLRRGGGNAPSRWQLLMEPNEAAFRDAYNPKIPNAGRLNAVEQGHRDLARRVSRLEHALGIGSE